MNKRTIIIFRVATMVWTITGLLFGWLLVATLSGDGQKGIFDPDVELNIPGLVCSSCGFGIKKGFKKTNLTKLIKFDIKKQICQIEFVGIEIHPSQMQKIIKDAGYELKSIKWLKKKEPNRYNQP